MRQPHPQPRPDPVLTRALFVMALTAVVLVGCGADGDRGGGGASGSAVTAPASGSEAATSAQIAGQDRLPEQPQVALDFRSATASDLTTDPGARARSVNSALELELRDAGVGRAAPREQPPGEARVVVVAARVRDPKRLGGRAGIFCRGDRAGDGYELTLDRAGAVRLDRIAGGRRATLARGVARVDAASPPDSPIPLFLVCGRGDERSGPHVVFTVGAQEAAGVRDPSPLPPGSGSRAGMLVDGERGDSALFTVFTLTYGP
jgi:hypothetical protein